MWEKETKKLNVSKPQLNVCTASQLADRGLCRVCFHCPAELRERATKYALAHGMSRTQLIIESLEEKLERGK